MARKLYFNKGANASGGVAVRGGSSGMTILLIFVPVLAFMLYSKRRGQQSATATETAEEKKKKKEEKKAAKKPVKAKIGYSEPSGEGMVDEEWEALKAAHPNNPFYQDQPMPEGWTGENQRVNPVYKITEEGLKNKKGVAKPYKDGMILPYDSRTDERVHFSTPEGEQPIKSVALIDPYSYIPQERPTSEFDYRESGTAYKDGAISGRGSGVKAGSAAFHNLPSYQNKLKFIELTNSLSQAPVSMSAEHLAVLLSAVGIATANPDPNSPACKKAMEETWSDQHGTFPSFVHPCLLIIEKYFKDGAFSELLAVLPRQPQISRHHKGSKFNDFVERLGLDPKRERPELKPLILGWFFDHFRLWDRKVRMFISNENMKYADPPTENLKGVYRLLTWVEVLGQSCAQAWLLSPRGFDFPGLTVRIHNQPLPPSLVPENRIFDMSAAIFLPTYSGAAEKAVEEWYERAARVSGADQKGTGAYNGVASMLAQTREDYAHRCGIRDPNAFRSLIFRPGWSLGAVLKTGDVETAFKPGAEPPKDYVNDGRMFVHEYAKGSEASPGATGMYRLFHDIYLFLEPEIVRFKKRAQYSWSETLTSQTAGFREGQIAMCLGSLSTIMAMSRTMRDGHADSDNHANKPTYPKYLDFGDSIPLETETNDGGAKTYSFPSLRDFAALERIYIPYVSLDPNVADRTPEKYPESTATLALHEKLDLYKQLDERRKTLSLVVICRDGKDDHGRQYSAEDWCGRLEIELRMEAKKLNRKYEDYQNLIFWTKDDGTDPNKKTPMKLLPGDVAKWRLD